VKCPRRVDWRRHRRRHVIDDVTSRGYDVILVTSQCSASSHSETRKLGSGSTIHVDPLSIQYRRTLCFKINSFGLELWEKKHLA